MRVTLTKGDLLLELDPCAGGAVSRLKHRDLDVLRAGPERVGPAFDPIKYAAFPMIPFVGRIHEAGFGMNGHSVELHANFPPEPHAIHGHGWQDVWKIESQTKTTATLFYHHDNDAWPWDYDARQTFRINDHALAIELSVTNRSATMMPAGLGWHPYFPREGSTLIVPTTHIWNSDPETGENIPAPIEVVNDLSRARIVERLLLDTTYSVDPRAIELSWPTHSVIMKSDPVFSHATVYVPAEQDFFCAEPITHAPNAVNSDLPEAVTGLKWLAPDETLSGKIKLSVIH